ncbi:MAG TPA: response regulator transcription factor [Actinocrinis sp.]|nr:response regulator transcription factor [Actinocrinis sp.]
MLRILIVDDQAVVRLGFSSLVGSQPDMTVVGAAGDGREAVRLAEDLVARDQGPHVVLMDIRMPVFGGIEATALLGRLPEPPAVIALTTFDLDDYVFDALRAGASGFLLKDATPEQILEAIRVVAAGDALLAPAVTRRLVARFARQPRLTAPAQLDRLTGREREVLLLVARGLSNLEIAKVLCLAEQTVKSHVGALLAKLGLRDRVQAVVLAYESGLVTPGAAAGQSA